MGLFTAKTHRLCWRENNANGLNDERNVGSGEY